MASHLVGDLFPVLLVGVKSEGVVALIPCPAPTGRRRS
jgi:hypothetical protein